MAGLILVAGLLASGLRDLRASEARARVAVDRATAAELAQRSSADELARVLKAAGSLALTGDGQAGYLSVLKALTPDGATSFLVLGDGEEEATVAAAHGPFAASVVGSRHPIWAPHGGLGEAAPVASYSAGGRNVGVAVPREEMAGADVPIEAGLSIRILDRRGRDLGSLHVLDHRDARILEPGFVGLTRFVANQIGVAVETNALLARVRLQFVEAQRAQRQLVQASRLGAMGELAAAVAREVNNPLTGILGYAELLMDGLSQDDERHDEAAVIRDQAVRARSIIRALLEFAEPRQPQRILTDLNDLVRSTLELVRSRASDADVGIAADYVDLACVEMDADALGQVLLSLFNNAIDAMPRGGRLHVTTAEESGRVGVVVSDDGIGMDDETLGRIFTPFFSARTGSIGRIGLGLSVSLQIIENHGGTIEVESAPGHGSTFTVWLPRSWSSLDGSAFGAGTDSTALEPFARPGGDADRARSSEGERCAVLADARDRSSDGRAAA